MAEGRRGNKERGGNYEKNRENRDNKTNRKA